MAVTKSKLGASVPHPAKQGGHGKAPVQQAKVQSKKGAAEPGPSKILFTVQPSGTHGSGTEKGTPGKGAK